ncbi:putative uncharacterized protein DDB_G0282133 isoform X1 [Microplitis mediator]|uniref:putative uncharacterized protein DDB_G0282133 isoform X1 n=1 Tax=Microplitis mediator TaxID=375433 RepID=UPI00255603B7|nr:putative uncharacterized protein DDB_G0282133 isoform X1 [Microplitis mediator]
MALSKVLNLTSIGNNTNEKLSDINMYDTSVTNSISDPTRCREYNPWNYDLMSRNKNHKMEDEETQDLNNSMVNDLVSKVLDDDPIPDKPINNNYNVNQYDIDQIKSQNHSYYKSYDLQHEEFIKNHQSAQTIKDNRDIFDIYSNLESLCINDLVSQDTFYLNNNKYKNLSPAYNDLGMAYSVNDLISKKFTDLQPQHQLQPQPQYQQPGHQTWTDFDDIFDSHQQFPSHDLNYNPISPSIHQDHQELNHQQPSLINIQDFNSTNQPYNRSNSAMTDFSTDSGFLSNSPLQNQHLSPDYSSYSSGYRYDDAANSQNSSSASSLMSATGFKAYDYDYKGHSADYINNYHENDAKSMAVNQKIDDTLIKMLTPSSIKLNDNHNNKNNQLFNYQSLQNNHNQLPGHQNNSNQGLNCYQYRVTPRVNGQQSQPIIMDQLNKYNYPLNVDQNYQQRYTANNYDYKTNSTINTSLSMINNNNCYQTNGSKSLNNHNYDTRTDTSAIGSINYSNLAAQLRNADPNLLHSIIKQQQQQQQSQPMRMPDMLMNARLIRANGGGNPGASAAGTGTGTGVGVGVGVYPSMLPVPLVQPILNAGAIGLRGIKARRAGASSILHLRLEQTFDQFKQLEKERKKCEAGLAAHFPGKRVTSANNIPVPRLQGNPSRADRLIIDHLREHARVITLIAKMEHLRGVTMNERVHKAMEFWLESIKFVQECRKKEITHATKRQKENPHCSPIHDDKDIIILAESIRELTRAARLARTAMFNAMQSTLLQNKDIEKKIIETSSDVILGIITKESSTAVSSVSSISTTSPAADGNCTSSPITT